MLFNSYEFIFIFLPFTFFVYFYLLNRRLLTAAKGFLVFSSLFFYSWWNIIYLPIILSSILFNYIVGNTLNNNFSNIKINKKTFLGFGIIVNLSLLGYFKYSDFFLKNLNLALDINLSLLHIALPLAISFFTFQQIAYLVDSYRGETKNYDFLNYTLFVTFFPQLIAGPIVHHSEMMPQFYNKWNLVKNYKNIALGVFIFSIGLFKKVVVADTFATWVTNGFNNSAILNLLEAWATSLSYTFQLYFDFSGYTDMAIGIALIFNIKLPINFNSPYKAISIQEFWRKWHITLSRFLRDYIYIPLGGNRKGIFNTYINLIATFLIGGIWHGAGWTFVFWGFLHGIAIVINHIWKNFNIHIPKFLAWLITFNFINISWVFFRAEEWSDALNILNNMFFGNFVLPYEVVKKFKFLDFIKQDDVFFTIDASSDGILWILGAFIVVTRFKNSSIIMQDFRLNIRNIVIIYLFFIISILHFTRVSEFLYFNF